MAKVINLSYVLLGLTFILAFFANTSTNQVRRQQLYIMYFVSVIIFWGIWGISSFREGSIKVSIIPYNLLLGFGLVLPQLISRIFIRPKLSHPVIFLKKKILSLAGVGGVFSWIFFYLAWVALTPDAYNLTENKPVYDQFFVYSSFSFLLFFIPLIILCLEMLVERNALCENGLYQGGLLLDWSNFKSYSWPQGQIYSDPEIQPFLDKDVLVDLIFEHKKAYFKKQIRLAVPLAEKNAIESLLSKKLKVEQAWKTSIFPKPT